MKILYISYYYPPYNEIASLRSMYQVKYLRQLGVDVSVICFNSNTPSNAYKDRNEADYYVYSTPTLNSLKERFLSKKSQSKTDPINSLGSIHQQSITSRMKLLMRKAMGTRLIEVLASLYRLIHHLIFFFTALFKAIKVCIFHRYDFVYASYGPESTILIGFIINKLFGIRLITEFRDRWLNHPYHFDQKNYIHRKIIEYTEKLIVSASAVVIGVSPGMIDELENDHPNSKIELIYNGYDKPPQNNFDLMELEIPTGKINLVYTGGIYVGRQNLDLIFKALNNISWPIQFIYCGKSYDHVDFISAQNRIESKVINLGFQSNHISRILQSRADVLLLLGWDDPRDKGVLTGKIFEYLDSKKPILFQGYPNGDVNDLLVKTHSGKTCSTEQDVINFLNDIRNESHDFSFSNINQYTRSNQTKKLHSLLEKIEELCDH